MGEHLCKVSIIMTKPKRVVIGLGLSEMGVMVWFDVAGDAMLVQEGVVVWRIGSGWR